MKRNMELIRKILLRLESLQMRPNQIILVDGSTDGMSEPGESIQEINYQLKLLQEAGMFRHAGTNGLDDRIKFNGLSWEGHDFLDSIRSESVWEKTKDATDGIGSWTFEIVKELGKGFIKKQIEDRTGIKL
ncbi:hypothetical protein WN73_21395 [Bradyrhizobium sp. CCBAU 45394]|uniref:DUF2513 domain-containing protein n=1 Tax=Bradyrhizobium sp. CCBAU 45394 TaxID=1325087 RepID=UPI00230285B6|nr:DUF2513 domain-containing protein [Bradyrhizobium sp. CCBAU 45394]MDA9393077.1 hypothetical protein [Bradyrhizobium sp. CCBAU 45394]